MSTEQKPLDLEAIEARKADAEDGRALAAIVNDDVPALVAEVKRLRALLTKAIVYLDDTDDLEQAERAAIILAESGLPLELP